MGDQILSSAMLTQGQYILGVFDTCQCTSAGSAMPGELHRSDVFHYFHELIAFGSCAGLYLSQALCLFRIAEVSQDCADLRGSILLARLLRLRAAHHITHTSRLAHAVPVLLLMMRPMHVMGSEPSQTQTEDCRGSR